VHTDYVQWGAGTGRLSSQAPNLQNIPQESKWAKPLRSAFVSKKGYSFLAADYSQIELRVLAELSGDKNMRAAFTGRRDIHKVTASKVLGIPEEKVGPNERRLAKTLNFGLIYGMGANSFAKTSGLTREKAKEFIDAYFREFGSVRSWQEDIKRKARTFGYVETLTGRRRYLFGFASDSGRMVAESERVAINFPVQGFGADLIKLAMIGVAKKVERSAARILLSIHDELLLEVRDDMIEETARTVRSVMENIHKLSVPLEVSMSSGKDWGHLQSLS
jgi:DNA polymerase-1